MITGTGSGCGKTTVTVALLASLAHLGMKTASFKCGPDYIDPTFHGKALGADSRNLDVFLMGEEGVKYALARNEGNREIALLESAMGLYDGQGETGYSSGNHISLLTDTPVILVVGAKGMSLSICAIIKGFMEFDKNNICAVVLNEIKPGMYGFYKKMIEERLKIDVIGYLPNLPDARIESRRLGLVAAGEIPDMHKKIGLLKESALQYIDMHRLLKIAGQAAPLEITGQTAPLDNAERATPLGFVGDFFSNTAAGSSPCSFVNFEPVKIYASRDEAFFFFYEDNHDMLRAMGAEIAFFSPLRDESVPDDADGLIIWGGYPELHGAELAANEKLRYSLNAAINKGLPVYAESGGFVCLQESLTDSDGVTHRLFGAIRGNVKVTEKLQGFGYFELEALADNMMCRAGEKINAHFFRYAAGDNEGCCFVAKKRGVKAFDCIVSEGGIFAGFQHLHFWGNPSFARNFINACVKYKRRRQSAGDVSFI